MEPRSHLLAQARHASYTGLGNVTFKVERVLKDPEKEGKEGQTGKKETNTIGD
jgi:hypothetical protein